MTTATVLAFAAAALLLAIVAVLIDRLNFPQPRFRPRTIAEEGRGPFRDRTGAHIVHDDDEDAEDEDDPGEDRADGATPRRGGEGRSRDDRRDRG